MSTRPLTVGVDVGGTFTDVLLADEQQGRIEVAKVFSAADQSDGILAGVEALGADLGRVGGFVHGTTVATNALLERRGARVGLIATAGFRDVVELRRRDRPDTYGLTGGFTPLVPRRLRVEVDERVASDGQIVRPLDARSVARACDALAGQVDAVAIALLNSHANPLHERDVARIAHERLGVPVAVSSSVVPELGEFERTSTTAASAFVLPEVRRYLTRLSRRMAEAGLAPPVLVVLSNGHVVPAAEAAEAPIRTALSGPAAGVVAAAQVGEAVGVPDVISCDMGGTSFDVALIEDGRPSTTNEKAFSFGVPLRTPMIDIHTVGAGGGSIARVDAAGLLRVGPRSAGSLPGPAAYGRGGTEPTVTDANVVLGRLGPETRLGTERKALDVEAAARAVGDGVARPLGLTLEQAAEAIVTIANQHMAAAIRQVSLRKGRDPRRFALVGFGGAGPLHVVELARRVGSPRAIVPAHPGVLSALGCAGADVGVDATAAVNESLERLDPHDLRATCAAHAADGLRFLAAQGFAPEACAVTHAADMSYVGQQHTIRVELGGDDGALDPAALRAAFEDAYRSLFGSVLARRPLMVWSLRTVARGARAGGLLVHHGVVPDGVAQEAGERDVHAAGGWHRTPVLRRAALAPGVTLPGPLVVEQQDATTFVPPGALARVHASGALIIDVADGSA